MKLNLVPQQIIPARYEVVFKEDKQTEGFVDNSTREDKLRPDIQDWLDTHAPGHTLFFDRGDWGEGIAIVTITFLTQESAEKFHAAWNGDKCTEVSYTACPHMRRISDTDFKCSKCDAGFTIYKPERD